MLDPDTNTRSLAGSYYLITDYEGYSRVQYGRGWLRPAPVLVGPAVDSVGQVGPYLVVCEGDDEVLRHYYLLPLAARSAAQAQAGRQGPLTLAAYHGVRRQLAAGAPPPLVAVRP
ncbi:MAG: hypothetical protein ACRYFK_08605 [Janthinobacterium lividum]